MDEQQVLVRYSDRYIGSQTGQMKYAKEHDENGNVVTWRVYPERTWAATLRERWLSLTEARLWERLGKWSIQAVRNVNEEKGNGGDMQEALVEYVGRRRGKFTTRMEGFPVREWAAVTGRKEMWLPVDEAELWDRQRDWLITRTRVLPDAALSANVQLAEPAPPAKHVSTLLEEAKAQVQQVAEQRETDEAQFCLSDNGVAHKRGCTVWPKHPLEMFDTFADAVNHEDFDRAHKLCCKAELVLQRGASELKQVLEEVEGGLAQMNVLSESYGIQAAEA